MKEFVAFIFCSLLIFGGLWLAVHETRAQEIITSLILLFVSGVVVMISLKILDRER